MLTTIIWNVLSVAGTFTLSCARNWPGQNVFQSGSTSFGRYAPVVWDGFWYICLVILASQYLTRSPIYLNNNDFILPYYVLAFKMGKECCAQSAITAYAFPNLGVFRCCWWRMSRGRKQRALQNRAILSCQNWRYICIQVPNRWEIGLGSYINCLARSWPSVSQAPVIAYWKLTKRAEHINMWRWKYMLAMKI